MRATLAFNGLTLKVKCAYDPYDTCLTLHDGTDFLVRHCFIH